MKLLKMSLIALLVLVTVMFSVTELGARLSGKQDRPRIQCDSDTLKLSVRDGEQALLAGVTATDRQDGDLTDRIQILSVSKLITGDTAKVTYLVFDSDDNMHSLTRQIHYTDYRRPEFSIKKPLVYSKNEAIALLDRIAVTDVLDGDITASVRVSTLSATQDAEVYTVSLQVTNSMGDTAKIELPIVVAESDPERPMVYLREYLTHVEQGGTFSTDGNVRSVYVNRIFTSTEGVYVEGEVDTSVPGVYWVRYYFTQNGKTGMTVQTVVVEPAEVDDHE